MAFTPLLKQLNPQGTTFYTFSSAARDLSKCMANSQKEFVFSHFVCINIPDFINPNNYEHTGSILNRSSSCPSPLDKNYTQLGGIHDLVDRDMNATPQDTKDTSLELAESFQDYIFNFEELLISNSNDNNTDRSVAERVFWHWMRNTGAINWTFDKSKIAQYLINSHSLRFVEGMLNAPDTYVYNNVVKYIGNIDITNNVDIANEAYTEIYVHIPSEAGMTPTVLFEQEFDGNFSAEGSYDVPLNQDFILGQTVTDPSLPIKDIRALYDDSNGSQHKYKITNAVPWPSNPDNPAEPVTIQDIYPSDMNWQLNPYKTDIDGMCIDFDANSYAEIVMNNLPNMDEFNKTGSDFEFNAVLIYYDIVDRSSQNRTSNLYGILFLDNVKSESWDYLQRYPKYKPVAGTQNGNSYGFKLNLRIDIEPDKSGITTLVNEYNTFSMSLFSDAMARMQECAEMFARTRQQMSNIESRLSDIETLMTMIHDYENLSDEVKDLALSLENANLALADRNTLLDLISHVSDNVDSIMNGRANVSLQYNTDVIRNGYDIDVDTNTPNVVKINSKTSSYNLCYPVWEYDGLMVTKTHKLDLSNINNNNLYIQLNTMRNMVRIYTENHPSAFDILLYIDSALVNWKTGQSLKIVFPDTKKNTFNNHMIKIIDKHTGNTIDVIQPSELMNDNPIIELICLDSTMSSNEPFTHDILK